jgi:hypothetical protein
MFLSSKTSTADLSYRSGSASSSQSAPQWIANFGNAVLAGCGEKHPWLVSSPNSQRSKLPPQSGKAENPNTSAADRIDRPILRGAGQNQRGSDDSPAATDNHAKTAGRSRGFHPS